MFERNFSKEIFDLADSNTIKQLAQELENIISERLFKVVMPELENIINDLNSQGHKLELRYEPKADDISYIDISNGKANLRVGFDSVISVGYSDLIGVEES